MGVEKITPLTDMIKETTGNNFEIKIIGRNQIKIQLQTSKHFNEIVTELKIRKTEFHTYQLKTDKTFKAVIKNLHHNTDKDELQVQLEELGHTVVRITNVYKMGTKIPLPLFTNAK